MNWKYFHPIQISSETEYHIQWDLGYEVFYVMLPLVNSVWGITDVTVDPDPVWLIKFVLLSNRGCF